MYYIYKESTTSTALEFPIVSYAKTALDNFFEFPDCPPTPSLRRHAVGNKTFDAT